MSYVVFTLLLLRTAGVADAVGVVLIVVVIGVVVVVVVAVVVVVVVEKDYVVTVILLLFGFEHTCTLTEAHESCEQTHKHFDKSTFYQRTFTLEEALVHCHGQYKQAHLLSNGGTCKVASKHTCSFMEPVADIPIHQWKQSLASRLAN